MHFSCLYTRCLALLLREDLRVSDKSVLFYAQSAKLQVYFDSPTFGKTMGYQAAPKVQSKNIIFMKCFIEIK